MLIETKSSVFDKIMREHANISKETSMEFFNEAISIQEDYTIEVISTYEDYLNANIPKAQLDTIINFAGGKDSFHMKQVHNLKKTDNGIEYEISGTIGEKKTHIGKVLMGYDGELHIDDMGTLKAVKNQGLDKTANEFNSVLISGFYAIGHIIYNINNKVTIQKQKNRVSLKTKKVKKANSRKKETKKIIVNTPIIEYTSVFNKEFKAEDVVPKEMHYSIASWESRGYWRTNGKTKKREWVKGSVKKRKDTKDDVAPKRQEYIFK